MTIDEPRLSAGWYPDPEAAGERWWNGSQWTSHTRASEIADGAAGSARVDGQSPIAWSASDHPLATAVSPSTPTGTAMFAQVSPTQMLEPAGPLAIRPGWYPDPMGLPAQRWWNGMAWTADSAPAGYGGTTVVLVSPPKSVGVALVLTFFFGPFGMFYSTVSGALIMLAILFFGGFVMGVITLGLAWLVWWPMVWLVSMIWGCVAAGNRPGSQVINTYR